MIVTIICFPSDKVSYVRCGLVDCRLVFAVVEFVFPIPDRNVFKRLTLTRVVADKAIDILFIFNLHLPIKLFIAKQNDFRRVCFGGGIVARKSYSIRCAPRL